MSELIDYSVVIRTTGNAHEKYQALLDSIARLEPKPEEIIVVLPEGYQIPNEQIGTETFIFSKKGMVSQRMEGINQCRTQYALVCDDDVSFNKGFVRRLYEPVKDGEYGISAGPLYEFLPRRGKRMIFDWIRMAAVPTLFHRDRYVSVLKSTGYSYNRHLKKGKYYESQSVAGTCFFVNVKKFKQVKIEEEIWIDANGYAAMEDQVMIYKSWLRDCKTVVVPDAHYNHLDARTSTRNKNMNIPYSRCINRLVFWDRFIYNQQHNVIDRMLARCAWRYRLVWEHFYEKVSFLRGRITEEEYKVIQKGWQDGEKYLKSTGYKNLPPVV